MEKGRSSADELALIKSAAWAWLEHGSGVDGRSMPEFDVSRAKFNAKPSRYKVEAVRKVQEKSHSTPTKSTSHSNGYHSLLDRYDIERISRQLDYYIESSRRPNRRDGGYDGRRARAEAEVVAAAGMKSKSGGKKVSKGIWLGSHAPLACGTSRDEVVDIETYSRRRRSLEKRRAATVEVVGCRPRQGIRA